MMHSKSCINKYEDLMSSERTIIMSKEKIINLCEHLRETEEWDLVKQALEKNISRFSEESFIGPEKDTLIDCSVRDGKSYKEIIDPTITPYNKGQEQERSYSWRRTIINFFHKPFYMIFTDQAPSCRTSQNSTICKIKTI